MNPPTTPFSTPTNTPDDVSTIVKQIAKQRGPLDLREFQGELYRAQRAQRTVNSAAVFRKSAIRRFRSRVRLPFLKDCKVIDTRLDSRGKLFFELENGMAIRADKAAPRVRNRSVSPAKTTNPLLRKLILSEVEKNASRAAA
jgi:hypothetical protein